MSGLAAFQQQFLQGLLQNETGANSAPVILKIEPGLRMTPAEQFQVYQNSVTSSLIKALKRIYPVCVQLVGEDFFNQIAREYISLYPSNKFDLNQYGEHFAVFIAGAPDVTTLPYLSDVARLEWAWHCVYSAADAPVFDFEKLNLHYAKDPDNIIFALAPGSTLFSSIYPIEEIWSAHQHSDNDWEIKLLPDQRFNYLIWRHEYVRRIDRLTEEECQLLGLINMDTVLADICDNSLFATQPELLQNLITNSLHNGWITSFCDKIN